MRYPNAKNGVNKLFIAIIISLAAAGLDFITSIILIASWGFATAPYYAFLFMSEGASVAAAVFTILGLKIAARDNRTFDKAVTWTIVGIAAGFGGALFGVIPFVGWLFEMAGTIVAIIANYIAITTILQGCTELLQNSYFTQKASTIRTLLIVAIVLISVGAVFSPIPFVGILGWLASIGGAVVSIVYEVFYLLFIIRAKNAL